MSGTPYLAINTESKRKRGRENGEKKREQWRRGQKNKVSCVVSMNGEVRKTVCGAVYGAQEKKSSSSSMSTYFQHSHNFSQSLSILQGQHKRGKKQKTSRQICLCQDVFV